MRNHAGQVRGELTTHIYTVFKPELQHRERALDALVEVDLLLRSLIHVSVFFDRPDQFGNASGAGFDLARESFRAEGCHHSCEDRRQHFASKLLA